MKLNPKFSYTDSAGGLVVLSLLDIIVVSMLLFSCLVMQPLGIYFAPDAYEYRLRIETWQVLWALLWIISMQIDYATTIRTMRNSRLTIVAKYKNLLALDPAFSKLSNAVDKATEEIAATGIDMDSPEAQRLVVERGTVYYAANKDAKD